MKSINLSVWKILATTAMTTVIACGSSSDTTDGEGGVGPAAGVGGAAGSGTGAGGKGGKGGAAGATGGHAGASGAVGTGGTAGHGGAPQGAGGSTAGHAGTSAGTGGMQQGAGGKAGAPQGQGGTTTVGQGGTTTVGQGGTTTVGQGGTTTVGQGGTTTVGQGGTTTVGQGGTTTVGQGGTTTVGQGGTDTVGQGGTTTVGQGGSTTVGQGGTTTVGQGGTTTVGQGGTTTVGQGGTTTVGQGGTTTVGQGGTTTVGQGGSTTVGQGGSVSTGGSTSQGAGGCTFIGGGPGCGTGGSSSTGAGGSLSGCGNGDQPDVDDDKDGWTENQGDCNDCDPNVNPGALDIINVDANGNVLSDGEQVDEDCDKHAYLPSEAKTCDGDASLTLAATDPFAGTAAIDLCRPGYALPGDVKTPGGMLDKWGVVSASYVQLDGKKLPAAGDVGHGIQTAFGPNVKTQLGKNMLELSSGTARLPGQIGFQNDSGADKGYQTTNPPGFPIESPSCPGIMTGPLHDSVALQVTLKVPTNANSFSFKFKFYTYEFPDYTCSQFNDVYVTLMSPVPTGGDVKTGNISFDPMMDPLSVNAAFLDVCDPQTAGGKVFTCPAGNKELAGTGFDAVNAGSDHAGTTWLQTTAPVTPGSTITLTFGISDAGDGVLASSVLIDDFQWSAQAGTVATESCRTGGTAGQCTQCIQKGASNCCSSQYQACKFDQAADGCDQLLSCLSICGGVQACTDQCHATHGTGEPEYTALEQCLYGVSGDKNNRGACGVACGTP